MNIPAERPQSDFHLTDDAFADIFALSQSDPESVAPTPFVPFRADDAPSPAGEAQPFTADDGWHWQDAALIAVERTSSGSAAAEYAIGVVDLYANARTGDLGGSYLEIGTFGDVDRAADLYRDLQADVDMRMLLPFQLVDFAAEAAHASGTDHPVWRTAGPAEYAAYEAMRDLEVSSDLRPADIDFELPEIPPEPVIGEIPQMADDISYSFGTGVTEDGEPALQAVKRWREGGEAREARQTIDIFGMSDEAALVARELSDMLHTDGLPATMRLAEDIARDSGQLQPRDTRLFSDGPLDPYTAEPDLADPVQRFRDAFADILTRPLEPVDPVVNYSFDLVDTDPWTLELTASKWWLGGDGALRRDQLSLNAYSMEYPEVEREIERERAAMDREYLAQTHREEGLEASMRRAEALSVAQGDLDPNREDGRLFYEGPPDRFTTLRELQLTGREHEAAVPDRDEWQELLDRVNNDQPEPEPHFWLLHHRPVETPDGAPLGTALVMIEFPQLTPDFGAYLEENGMDDSIYPTEARRLELAHFADEAASRKFEAEFRSYLVPGVIDGPELAPEVAKLEGLPGVWDEIGYWDLVRHMSGGHAIVKDATEWHLHSPHAEREVRDPFETVDLER